MAIIMLDYVPIVSCFDTRFSYTECIFFDMAQYIKKVIRKSVVTSMIRNILYAAIAGYWNMHMDINCFWKKVATY